MRSLLLATLLFPIMAAAQQRSSVELAGLAQSQSPQLQQAIRDTFSAKDLAEGTAWRGHLHDFFFAAESDSQPTLIIDNQPATTTMQQISGTRLWYAAAQVDGLGALHRFAYVVAGKPFGGKLDLPAFTPDSYQQPGVPTGTLSPKLTYSSKIYDGMSSEYWIYVPAQYNSSKPAALMVFQDGSGYLDRNSNNPALNVIDNLTAQGKIPVMIAVFINPGDISAHPATPTYKFVEAYGKKWSRTLSDSMRSTEYDTVSDRYPRFLRDEILAEVAARYNLRKDSYSRAITGLSSGGICSFNAAWQQPDQFSRVISWIGSFTAIQWHEDPAVPDGGQDYPEKVLREPHRNLRVWIADGANDQENDRYGSWPMANLRLYNALHLKHYDAHLSFAHGTHSSAQGASEFPAELAWLWRGYDSSKTSEVYAPEAAEDALPPVRVEIINRTGP